MPHYKLDSPAAPNTKLSWKGKEDGHSIYRCDATSTYWILHAYQDGRRTLRRYYLAEGTQPARTDLQDEYLVPEDWTGDPETIPLSLKEARQMGISIRGATNLSDELKKRLEDGDKIVVSKDMRRKVCEVVSRQGQYSVIPGAAIEDL